MDRHVDELLARAREDDLAPAEAQRLTQHLAECARCRARADEMARNESLLRALSAPLRPGALPPTLADLPRRRPSRAVPRALAGLGVAATLVVALIVGLRLPELRQQIAQPTDGPAAGAPQKGGRIIAGQFSDIRTLQPVLAADAASGSVWPLIYDRIIQADPQSGEPKPRMATFALSPDGRRYTFEIDAKINWSDGRPVVAEDWLTGLKAVAKSQKTTRKGDFANVVGFNDFAAGTAQEIPGVRIDPANPKKWTVTLAQVQCDGIFQLNGYTIPAHVFGKYVTAASKDEIDTAPENDNPQVASGPFKFKEWRKGDQVILTRNDTYWQGAPHVDEYVFKVVADTTVLAAQLKTGALNLGEIGPHLVATVEREPHLRVTRTPGRFYTFIGWRTNSPTVPAFADKRVRQALAYGLDMDAVIKAVLFGEGRKQVAHHLPVQWAYPDPSELNQYPFDPAKARQMLDEAGWRVGTGGIRERDGRRFSFTIRTSAGAMGRETMARLAAEQYRQLGIEVKAEIVPFRGLLSQLTEGSAAIEAVIIGWSLGASVDPHGIWHSSVIPDPSASPPTTGLGFTFFRSEALDRAIMEGRSPANGDCSIATRKRHYATFNRILNDEQPYNFGFTPNTLHVTQQAMQNFKPGPFSVDWNVHEWWFKR